MLKRYVILEGIRIMNVTEAEEEFGTFMGWTQSDTGNIGDEWNGVAFVTPPPPMPTEAAMNAVLESHQMMREAAKRNALRIQILAAADPPVTNMTGFIAAVNAWTWVD